MDKSKHFLQKMLFRTIYNVLVNEYVKMGGKYVKRDILVVNDADIMYDKYTIYCQNHGG